MPAEFEQGFFVREPAWHGMGVVLDDYPGREEAMVLAGHNFDVLEFPVFRMGMPISTNEEGAQALKDSGIVAFTDDDGRHLYAARPIDGWKEHRRSDTGALIHVSKESYQRIPNSVPYDFAEILLEEGFKYETGISLRGGAVCALTLYLDEPVTIKGDTSIILPYLGLSWAHDGTAALKGRSTSVRQVCANTVAASEAEGARLGTDFTIRHTTNWRDQVEQAQQAMKGTRDQFAEFVEIANQLADVKVTPDQRELFIHTLIPLEISRAGALVSDRVVKNVDTARAAVMNLFDGPTIPEAHKLTAYGLHLAGVEYLDHLRGFRNKDTYVGRTLLKHDTAKAKLVGMIEEVCKA